MTTEWVDAGGPAAGARPPLPDAVTGPRVIAIARRLDPDSLARIADGLLGGGVRAFEVTLDSAGAVEAIAALTDRFADSDLVVGAGTVLDADAARAAVAAGARFIVSPHTDPAIVAAARELGVPAFPGALTPTEVVTAWRAGASGVKVFPVSAVGPSFVRELRGPLRDVPLIPTGGVSLDNAPALIAAGAVAVGVGSWLIGDGDPDGIAGRGASLVGALARA
ncbi:MAG TPA: bifunctional 4-hydroxy-2-oxoglutarate aldolase/2-dehydro-3-deoxy-phosphogluconate aldolase [Candidatus Limnocylindrales bacterium]|nr:bifunctional 4-hydroxy-2-oxoglutarate aldolase/2-dehydro-3-deoxy-phosphogluconate aldolase [Candidatus Limnocylindrales bacterium]